MPFRFARPVYDNMLCRKSLRHMVFVLLCAVFITTIVPQTTYAEETVTVQTTKDKEAEEKPYGPGYIGDPSVHIAAYEDTLVNISRGYGLGFVELRAANPGIDPWIPGKGTKVKLPTRHLIPDAPRNGIIINLPEMRLYSFVKAGAPPLTFPIGVGRVGLDTPLGQTKVISKTVAPKWRPTGRMREEDPELPAVVGPGPANPLGTHALYLGWPEYAIHGTNKPYGIGRRVSSGCVRMYPENIKEFYYATPVGTKVTVINQPVKAAWIGNELYLEAHATLDQSDRVEEFGGYPPYEMTKENMQLILNKADGYENKLDWLQIRKVIRERSGYPVLIAERPEIRTTENEEDTKAAPSKEKDNNSTVSTAKYGSTDTKKPQKTIEPKQPENGTAAKDTSKHKRPVFKHNS